MTRACLLLSLAWVVLAAAPGRAAADEPAGDSPQLFRMKFKAGEQRRYRFTSLTHMDLPGLPPNLAAGMRIGADFGFTVETVSPDGTATVKVAQGTVEIVPAPPGWQSKLGPSIPAGGCPATISPLGKFTMTPGSCGTGNMAKLLERAVGGLRAVLPELPVRPGSSWKMPIDLDLPAGPTGGGSSLRGDATITFRERKTVDGKNCALMPMTGDLQMDASGKKLVADISAKISGESCFDLDTSDWSSAKMVITMKLFIGAGGQGINGTSTSTAEYLRLPDGPVPSPSSQKPAEAATGADGAVPLAQPVQPVQPEASPKSAQPAQPVLPADGVPPAP